MKIKLPWIKNKLSKELNQLERGLDQAFKPLKPRDNFSRKLKSQLVPLDKRKFLGLSSENIKFGLLVLGGAASTVLMLVTGARAFIALLAALGLIQQVNKQISEETPVSINNTQFS